MQRIAIAAGRFNLVAGLIAGPFLWKIKDLDNYGIFNDYAYVERIKKYLCNYENFNGHAYNKETWNSCFRPGWLRHHGKFDVTAGFNVGRNLGENKLLWRSQLHGKV